MEAVFGIFKNQKKESKKKIGPYPVKKFLRKI